MGSFFARAMLSLVALSAAFIGGAVSRGLGPPEARAQTAAVSTIYVPEDGLVFRALDGKPIAKLSRDGRGGVLELYGDGADTQGAAVRFSGGVIGAARSTREPYVLDDADPFVERSSPKLQRPGAGF